MGPDDVRKGYQGCFGDGDGQYNTAPWGSGRNLPAALNTDGFTLEQCAQAAGAGAYDVFAMQASGYCFLGQLADVGTMKRRLDNAFCMTTPCLNGIDCVGMVNKVFWFSSRMGPALVLLHIEPMLLIFWCHTSTLVLPEHQWLRP